MLPVQPHDGALGAAAHGARQVQRSRLRHPAGQDELLQRRQLWLVAVDRRLEDGDLRWANRWPPQRLRELFRVRRRELRADREQVSLHGLQHVAAEAPRVLGERAADAGVELVHLAVRVHSEVGLGHAAAAEQTRVAAIASLCVDLHPLPLHQLNLGERGEGRGS